MKTPNFNFDSLGCTSDDFRGPPNFMAMFNSCPDLQASICDHCDFNLNENEWIFYHVLIMKLASALK